MILRIVTVGAAVSILSLHVSAQSQPPSVVALTHAKIFTLAGPAIENGTLVIRDGKIAAVGANVEVPAGAQVIDAKGLQIYPGLFDPITQMA
jgi:imidazolonepropionase-like amidohydrolase